jgi:hypothetical protein
MAKLLRMLVLQVLTVKLVGTYDIVQVHCWFSEKFSHNDFKELSIHLDSNMQRSISAFETLAQIALVWLVALSFPGFRIPVCLKSLSDNTGAESVSNKLFTT